MDVRILSGNSALAEYGPLVPDLHAGCGPIGGMEAALAHSVFDWNLFLPVDLPLLPTAFLEHWVRSTVAEERRGLRLAIFTVSGVPQHTLLMIHRDAGSYVDRAVERGDYKLFTVLEGAGRDLAKQRGLMLGRVFQNARWDEGGGFSAGGGTHSQPWETITMAQQAARALWFANLNTPEEFAEAARHSDALDTV
jgi:molybdopterin-guanine dinucleotide biosynthesis protein A